MPVFIITDEMNIYGLSLYKEFKDQRMHYLSLSSLMRWIYGLSLYEEAVETQDMEFTDAVEYFLLNLRMIYIRNFTV